MASVHQAIQQLGLTSKQAQIYLAALELGEASVQELARQSKVKRTTIYYILEELVESGVLITTRVGKKIRYIPTPPRALLKKFKEGIVDFEQSLPALEHKLNRLHQKPRVYFLYGSAGFKQVWEVIFKSKSKEYRIITGAENFLDYVKEKYLMDEIIAQKKRLGISSKQLISSSDYGRRVASKDTKENRMTKFLPVIYKLPFTEIISDTMVAFISPRFSNMIFVVENDEFAKTRRSIFEMLWGSALS